MTDEELVQWQAWAVGALAGEVGRRPTVSDVSRASASLSKSSEEKTEITTEIGIHSLKFLPLKSPLRFSPSKTASKYLTPIGIKRFEATAKRRRKDGSVGHKDLTVHFKGARGAETIKINSATEQAEVTTGD